MNSLNVERLVRKIQSVKSVLLTTHKQCDGDGLGAMLGLYHALRKNGHEVRVMTVDDVPSKYSYLEPEKVLEVFEGPHRPLDPTELALIFDTNDRRMVEPLYQELEKHCREILFVDHHPVLNQGPEPTPGSFIDTRAASTGEISYFIIKGLGIRLDENIARALYTSIAFDTQLFRYVKSSPTSHLISAELLEYERNPEEIHQNLFSTHSIGKVAFLSKVLSEIEFFGDGTLAVLKLKSQDLDDHDLEMDDARDVIDMIMNINSLQAAALFREEAPNVYKLSLRSKGKIEILGIAESFQGGGHLFAAGALLKGKYADLKNQVVDQILHRLDIPSPSNRK
ncbi:MAG: DHH family phosphoesterase [Bdellovibrionaceae bacterium]|nr:DHH family phosphoesterase [Bdellovibrionales bacterium]MCB9084213.1 DHH family phosphoesterase [Pseudobdellovibrionaceae bacterium]